MIAVSLVFGAALLGVRPALADVAGTAFRFDSIQLEGNLPPEAPTLVAPADGATGVSRSPYLSVQVSDPEADDLTVTFFGKPKVSTRPDFTIVALPDTQFYTVNAGGDLIFNAQTQWVVDNQATRNIVFVNHLGNATDNGLDSEWQIADAAMSILESPAPGIPYGMVIGNRDKVTGSAPYLFEQYFGVARFTGRAYYGGHFGSDNLNYYELFSAGGMDFIVVNLDSTVSPMPPAVLDWADGLLQTFSSRRAIVIGHYMIKIGNPGPWIAQGQAIYEALKDRPNLFLMMGGHISGEGQRQDTYLGNTVYSLLSDYQSRSNGGDGWLRILEFSPTNNEIRVKTYSPTLDQWKTDADSQFTLPYDMTDSYATIGTLTGVASGSTARVYWTGLTSASEYQWYVTVSDGVSTTTGPVWSFTTATGNQIPVAINDTFSSAKDTALNVPSPGVLGNYSDPEGNLLTAIKLSDPQHGTPTLAQENAAFIRQVRVMESDQTGISNPAGLAFSSGGNAFHVVEARGQGQPPPPDTDITKLTPFANRAGSAQIAAAIQDPINMAFDNQANRLFLFKAPANQLLEVREDANGNLDPATQVRHDARRFGLQNPQGMAVNPASGSLFILDAAGPRIVRVEPGLDGSFENAVISVVDLQPSGLVDLRGLAFDPTTGDLHVVSPAEQKLYELTQTGQVVAKRDLSELGLRDPQGMVFAPSGDQTDDPSQMGLYLADRGRGPIELLGNRVVAATQSSGQIVEFSLAAPIAPAAPSFVSSLIQTTDMAAFSPPSPDPSGLAYLPSSNRLMMVDGEVEETISGITHFQGANVWEMTLGGSVVRTANISKIAPTVVPMTNEPTGVAWNPANGHFYVTDDNARDVFDLNPGPDGLIGTADDSWTQFDTLAVGSGDPEGIAFDSWNNQLFVADGVNMEVYQFTLTGSLVGQFDVGVYGVVDPESVEFNPDSGTLFVLSSNQNSPVAIETTTSGALLQTIDVSVVNARAAAGLAYAPASDGSGSKRFYIVDRGIDNDFDPNIIDGKMYEMTAPPPSNPGNTPPVANDDGYATDEDNALNVAAPGVLGNDSDDDGDLLAAVLDTGPVNGTLALNGDGSFSYTPNANFNGTDTFSYHANDGSAGSNIATVTITVNAVNDPPVASDDSASTTEGTPVTINMTANDSDPDGDLLTAIKLNDPQHGTLNLNGDGSFIYTPDSGFTGSDSFTYKANDGALDSNVANVSITVSLPNAPPEAVADSYSTYKGIVLNVPSPGVLGNDSDPEGDLLTAIKLTDPQHGTLNLSGDGSFTYTPNPGFSGSDSFTYKANDGALDSNVANVSITISLPNAPPEAVNDNYSTANDIVLNVPSPGVLGNDSDPEGDLLTAIILTDPLHGTLNLNGDGSFIYTPDPEFTGSDSFTYKANDGALDSNVANVSITVTLLNTPPEAAADSYSTAEDTALTIDAPGVLVNDTDAEDDPLTAGLVRGPSQGTLNLNPDGSFIYTPNANFNGEASFTYQASDGQDDSNIATVTVTVTPVNDPPLADDQALTTEEDTPKAITLSASDEENDPLTYSVIDEPRHGRLSWTAPNVLYTPQAGYHGQDRFTFRVNDGTADSNLATVSITVNEDSLPSKVYLSLVFR